MLPSLAPSDPRLRSFQAFLALVGEAQGHLGGEQAGGDQASGDQDLLKPAIASLEHCFRQRIQPLSFEDWPPASQSLLASLRLEMHKQLRLLSTDLMFLKTARQPATRRQRLDQMGDRFTTLSGYCTALIQASGVTLDETPQPDL